MRLHAMCLFLALDCGKGTDVVCTFFCGLQVGGSFLVLRVRFM
jgi:hypothetical protein